MSGWLTLLVVGPSAVWLVGVLLWRIRSGKQAKQQNHRQSSAVVVARNEERTIGDCLRALTSQSHVLETIYLFDDASADRTRDIANQLAAEHNSIRIHSVPNETETASPKKRALATAFQLNTAEVIALTDADCIVPSRWVDTMSEELDEKTGAVIGASWPDKKSTLSERVYSWERLVANSLMASACGWGNPASACGHSIVYSSTVLKETDAPVRRDLPSGDDDLTVQAVARAGYRVKFCADPESVVTDRGGMRGSRWQQAARHQSVTHLYPWYWRLLFALSILANVAALALFVSLPFANTSLIVMVVLLAKLFADSLTGATLARKLRLDIGFPEIVFASALLPIWTLWRTVASLFSRDFEWRGRRLTTSQTAIPSTGIHGS